MAMTKVKNLQLWCKKMTDGYRDVDVHDMTSSWKNGLAFCALIHKFRPDLIDYDSLSKENILENNQLAFDIAERELNIPAFLDAPDMVAIKVPDRLSVVTYVSQYYNNLHDKPQLGGPGVKKAVPIKRHQQDTDTGGPDAKRLTPSHLNTKTPSKDRQVSMGDKCHMCGDKVYLMERHVDKNKLYHRHCFRHSELSPTNKVFNKSELKKINDKVKSESESTKSTEKNKNESKKDDSGLDFWQRRNKAKKIEKMVIDDPVPSKDTGKSDKHENKNLKKNLDVKKGKEEISDIRKSSDIAASTKDRPSNLNLEVKAEVKVSHDLKPTPRTKKVEKSEPEPMDTSEFKSVNLKPVPTPRHLKDDKEKDKSRVNGLLSKNREKFRDKSPPSTFYGQKLSTSDSLTPTSPPPLPSQPPPAELVQSSLLSPREKKAFSAIMDNKKENNNNQPAKVQSSVTANINEKSKHVIDKDSKSGNVSKKTELTSPRTSKQHDGGSSVLLPSSVSKDKTKFSAESKGGKTSPKLHNKGLLPLETHSKFSEKPQSFDHHVQHAIHTTKNSGQNETVAYVFQPSQKQQEENDKQVLGGLLSNLANIRRKKNSETSPSEEAPLHKDTPSKGHKSAILDSKTITDKDQNKHSSNHESHSNQDSKKSDSDIPEWKKQLQKNKNARPKSADILSEKNDPKIGKNEQKNVPSRPKTEITTNGASRPKSADLFADKFKTEQKPQWQIEAEKRMEMRKGGYVDPEKTPRSNGINKDEKEKTPPAKPKRVDININDTKYKETKMDSKDKSDNSNDNNRFSAPIKPSRINIEVSDDKKETSHIKKRILPAVPGETAPEPVSNETSTKKRISVNVNFNFSKDGEEEKHGKLKPARPPPISPVSLKKSPYKPDRPPPPLKDADHRRLSPTEIQKQLTEIDSRLTDLEIRGRQLEDSIRKAQEEEDDKMMVEWFDLVNNKNELVRKEADLIYLSRAQELESEQDQIDNRLRELMMKDDASKTKEEKEEEQYLIDKKLNIVNQRNVIVDSIDEDRIRYEEEDKDIAIAIQALTDGGQVTVSPTEASYTKKKKKKKQKK